MDDRTEQMAARLEGSTRTEQEKNALVAGVARALGSLVSSGGDHLRLRDPMVAALQEDEGISLDLATYIWNEAARIMSVSRPPRVMPKLKDIVEKMKADVELEGWPFKIVKATSIGDLLRLTLDVSGVFIPMTMEIKDLYSQQRFREQYTVATGQILDRIKSKAFDSFISGLDIQKTEDTGTSVKEMLLDVLNRLHTRVLEAQTEEEIEDAMKAKGLCKYQDTLRFKVSKLRNELELKGIKPERLAQCLEDLGATCLARGVWSWSKHKPV